MSGRSKEAETGDLIKFKAEEVKSVRIKMDGWGKMTAMRNQT